MVPASEGGEEREDTKGIFKSNEAAEEPEPVTFEDKVFVFEDGVAAAEGEEVEVRNVVVGDEAALADGGQEVVGDG